MLSTKAGSRSSKLGYLNLARSRQTIVVVTTQIVQNSMSENQPADRQDDVTYPRSPMLIDCSQFPARDLYKVLIGSVVPRPIAWVSTANNEGVLNLAPFSFFNAFAASPPILGIGIGSRTVTARDGTLERTPKDTFINIRDTEEFVVNVVSKELVEKMVLTSGEYEPDVSEFKEVDIACAESTLIKPPRVADAKIAMECVLHQIVNLSGSANLVLGKIVCIHVSDAVYKDGEIDLIALAAVGRLSGDAYCDTSSLFEIERPVVNS